MYFNLCLTLGEETNVTIEVTTNEVVTKTPIISTTSEEVGFTTAPVTVIKTTTKGGLKLLKFSLNRTWSYNLSLLRKNILC